MRSTALAFALTCLVLTASCSRGPAHYLESGNRYFAAKNYDDAALQYRKALQQDPRFAEAQYRLGLTEIERGKVLDAYTALVLATELDPQKWEAKITLADLCVSVMLAARNEPQNMYARVVTIADELLKKDPNSFDGLRLKGYIAGLDRKPAVAIEYFRRVHKMRPDDVTVMGALAEVLLNDGDAAEGEALARETIAKNRAFIPPYDSLYRYYSAHNRPAEAEAVLRLRAENNPADAANWIQLAAHLQKIGKEQEMRSVLDKVLNNAKDFPSGKMAVGDFYARSQRFDDAVKLFEEGLSQDPSRRIEYLKRISNIQQAQGKREEALHTVEEILKAKPDDDDSLTLEASLLRGSEKREDRDRSLEIFRSLVKKNPDNAVWQLGLGRGLLDSGKDANEAQSALRQAIRLDPTLDAGHYLLAEVLINQGKSADALGLLNEVLVRKPGDLRARLMRVIAWRVSKNFDLARRELGVLEREYPKTFELQFQQAVLTLAEGKSRESSELFEKLYRTSPTDFRPLEGLVDARIAQNQVAAAVQLMQTEVKKAPDAVRLRLILASTASRAHQPSISAEQYEYLLGKDPKSVGLRLSLGAEQLAMNDPAKALATFQSAEGINPNNPAVVHAIALALEAAGRFPEAVTEYRRNLQLDPDNPVVQNNLAYLLAETGGDLDEALRLIQQAVRKMPQHPAVNDTLGWVYLKKNMTGSARQVFAALVKKDPGNAGFQYHLGSALYAQGDKVGARNALKAGLENRPAPLTEKKIRELLARLG